MNFIGRKEELEELNARFRSGRFEMGIVYGSRRIGKTSLLRKFVEDKASFYIRSISRIGRTLRTSLNDKPVLH